MKTKILIAFIALSFFINPYKSSAQINVQDSLALVDLYDSTNGDNWSDNSNWKTSSPVSSWRGITVIGNRVTRVYMPSNNITGTIPLSVGNLSSLTGLELLDNQIGGNLPASLGSLLALVQLNLAANGFSGNIPSSIGNLQNLQVIYLYNNQLTGSIPSSFGNLNSLQQLNLFHNQLDDISATPLTNLGNLQDLNIAYNKLTFEKIESLVAIYKANSNPGFGYSPQLNISISRHHEKLAASPGGTLINDTLRWYKPGNILLATIIGDTTYTPTDTGRYSVAVTNAVATELTLYSDPFMLNYFLADTSITVTQNVNGIAATNINEGILKLAVLTPTAGVNALDGAVTTTVTIDPAVSIFNGQPYVQRHYDITPAVNATTAQATVTLYFTQQDFDNFNSYVTTNGLGVPLLPTAGLDNGNVRIIQLHGSFTASPDPGNYNGGTPVIITPNVVWDNANEWWVVTFPVNGFSGFFLSTANFTLPLTLLEFKGKLQESTIVLQWLTTNEVRTKEFVIERSINGNIFNDIARVPARTGSAITQYNFVDINPLPGNSFYRLRMIDKDDKFTYSNIIYIRANHTAFKLSAYPNPANNIATLFFNRILPGKYQVEIKDLSGKILKRINGTSAIGVNKVDLVVRNYAPGTYFVTLIDDENGRCSLKLSKQ